MYRLLSTVGCHVPELTWHACHKHVLHSRCWLLTQLRPSSTATCSCSFLVAPATLTVRRQSPPPAPSGGPGDPQRRTSSRRGRSWPPAIRSAFKAVGLGPRHGRRLDSIRRPLEAAASLMLRGNHTSNAGAHQRGALRKSAAQHIAPKLSGARTILVPRPGMAPACRVILPPAASI